MSESSNRPSPYQAFIEERLAVGERPADITRRLASALHKAKRTKKGRHGLGTLYRRGESGVWWFSVMVDGRREQMSTGMSEPRQAEAFRLRRLADLAAGKNLRKVDRTLDVTRLLQLVLRDHEVKGHRSLEDARRRIQKHLVPHLGELKAAHFGIEDWQRYILARREEGASNASINQEGNLLRRGFNLARRRGMLSETPFIERLTEPPPPEGYCEYHDYLKLRAASPFFLQIFLVIAYETAARRSEVLGENRCSRPKKEPLSWDQVDFRSRTVRFEKTKNGEDRIVPFTGDLEQWLQMAYEDHLRNWPECPYVVHIGGKPVYDPRRTWNKARRRAGVKVTMHDFRRTQITDADRAGVSRKVAMGISGHKSEKTHTGYQQVRHRDLAQAARTIEEYRRSRSSGKHEERVQ